MVVMPAAFSWKSAGSQYAAFSQHTAFAARILLLARALRLAPSGHHRFGRVKQSVHGLRLHSISFVISSSQHVVVPVLVVVADPQGNLHYRAEHLHDRPEHLRCRLETCSTHWKLGLCMDTCMRWKHALPPMLTNTISRIDD